MILSSLRRAIVTAAVRNASTALVAAAGGLRAVAGERVARYAARMQRPRVLLVGQFTGGLKKVRAADPVLVVPDQAGEQVIPDGCETAATAIMYRL